MKKVFFALILNALVCYSAFSEEDLSQAEQECLSVISAPKVEVTSSYGRLRYDYSKDEAYLKKEKEKLFPQLAEENLSDDIIAVGLTKVKDNFDLNMDVGQVEIGHGYYCLYPEKIKAHIGYVLPTIYIAKSLRKGTCLFEVSLRHEKTHMQIYIEALDYFLPTFKKSAENLFQEVGVKVIPSPKIAKESAMDLNRKYVQALKEKVDAWRKEVEIEQQKLDSVENYLVENRLCLEEVK
jgi:hypothetical protein